MVDLARIECPVILRGNQSTAYRARSGYTVDQIPHDDDQTSCIFTMRRRRFCPSWNQRNLDGPGREDADEARELHLQLRRPIPPGAALYDQWNGRHTPTDSKFHR